jgi:hypothetical protein
LFVQPASAPAESARAPGGAKAEGLHYSDMRFDVRSRLATNSSARDPIRMIHVLE